MKMKYLLVTVILATTIVCSSGIVYAQTDNSALIAQIQAQINALMAQLNALYAQQGTTVAWCHNFNTSLGYANSGTGEVAALHTALQKENISYSPDDNSSYTEATGAAVVQFQGRYGIRQTGYVGSLTRAKLNTLYGCATTSNPIPTTSLASVILTSPNGGEQWKIGETHNITWTGANIPSNGKITVALQGTYSNYLFSEINNTGSVSWTIPSTIQPGNYKIRVFCGQTGTDWYCSSDGSINSNQNSEDFSNSNFTITNATTPTQPSIQPSISYITPTSASPGNIVTVYGSNFTQSTTIKIMKDGFMYTNLSNVYVSPTELQMRVDNTFFVNMDAGVTYQINASNTNGNSNSANFTLTSSYQPTQPTNQSSITVTSPNGGESWKVGETHDITWSSSNLGQYALLQIALKNYAVSGSPMYILSSVVAASSGRYSYTVPATFGTGTDSMVGSQWKAFISTSSTNNYASDESNGNFAIVAPTVASTSCAGYANNSVVLNSMQAGNGTASFNLTNTTSSAQSVSVSIGSGSVSQSTISVSSGACATPTSITYSASSNTTITFTYSGQTIASLPVSSTATASATCTGQTLANIDYYTKGTTSNLRGDSLTDYCVSGYTSYNLLKGYCGTDGSVLNTGYLCSKGCSNGACIR